MRLRMGTAIQASSEAADLTRAALAVRATGLREDVLDRLRAQDRVP
ncbi:MAG: hypothetical protein ACKOVB_12515 [Terrabacter sp.]